MSWDSKVIWYEGMYLLPQHFQQQERYLEAYVEGRCKYLRPYAWGFSRLELDEGALALGQIAVAAAAGILPDGTPFNIPAQDDPPTPLEIGPEVRNARVFLALPYRQADKPDTDLEDGGATRGISRYRSFERDTRDCNIGNDDLTEIRVGRRQLRLVLEGDDRAGLATAGMIRIREVTRSGEMKRRIELDPGYIPPCLDCGVSGELMSFMKKILGMIRLRADSRVDWVKGRGRLGERDMMDFLYLQVLNSYDTRLGHLVHRNLVHPEEFYDLALHLASDLAIFTSRSKRPKLSSSYDHDDLQLTFAPLMEELQRSLDWVEKRAAVQIPLERTDSGVFVGSIADASLFTEAEFILAINTKSLPERVQNVLKERLKIGASERIAKIVNDRIAGIQLESLQNVPPDIPPYRDYTYYGLQQLGDEWNKLVESGSCAFYFQGEAPGMTLLLWAVRGGVRE